MTQQKVPGRVITLLGLALIVALTLTPEPGSPPSPPSLCIVCGDHGLQDIILNVILFIPFGFGLRSSGATWRKTVAIALLSSVAIELLQIRAIPGRSATLGDVITNTTGGGVGALLAESWRNLVLPGTRQARRLFWCGSAACLALIAATLWGERTALPRTIYWGQWAPDLLNFDRFPGVIVRATVDTFPFPNGVAGDSPAFRRRLLSDTVLVHATVIPDGLTRRRAPIVSVYDWRRTKIFMLAQDGRDATFSMRMNASAAGFKNPGIRLPNVFPAAATHPSRDTLRMQAGIIDRELVLRVRKQDGTAREQRAPLGPGLGWIYFPPFNYAYGPEAPLFTALWLAALFALPGYWASRARRRAELVMAAALPLVALAALPLLFGSHSAAWWEWCGAVAGAAGGWAVGRIRSSPGERVELARHSCSSSPREAPFEP